MSWFKDVEGFFKKAFGSTTWEHTAETTLTFVAPLLETVVGLAAGSPAETVVSNVIGQAQKDLAGVTTLVQGSQGGSAKQDVSNALTTIQTNLKTLLSDVDVKNATEAQKITAGVTIITQELQAVLASI